MDQGFFKGEGLDAAFIATTGGVLVRAAIAKEIEFVPIPAGGSEAILQGAPLIFLVGQSLISQWTLTTTPDIKTGGRSQGQDHRPRAAGFRRLQ